MTVVDDSAVCLQHAQQQQQHQKQQQQQQQQSWMHCDTSALAQLPSASFDIVLSCMYALGVYGHLHTILRIFHVQFFAFKNVCGW